MTSKVTGDAREELLEPFSASPGHQPADGSLRDSGGTRRLSTAICLGWGVGALTMAMMSNVFNLLVLRFATDFLGIAAGAAGLLLAGSKLYDAVADPIIGTISDNWKSPSGRRRPLLLIAAFVCAAAILALFFVPRFEGGMLLAYYGVALLLFATAFAMWTVPYLAMSAEMTDDYHERSRLISYRVNFGALGLLVSSVCGPWLLVYWGGGRSAYQNMALVMASLILASALVCHRFTRAAPFRPASPHQSFSLTRQFRVVASNRPLSLLLLVKVFWYFGFAANQASLAFFMKHVAHMSDIWLGLYYIILPFGMVGAQPAWLWLAKRIDKRPAVILAMVAFGSLELSWLLAGPLEPKVLVVLRLLLLGVSAGGAILLIQSMFNDTIELDFRRNGERREGVFTGLFALVEKAFSAAGVASVGGFIGYMGYISSKSNAVTQQPESAVWAVAIAFAVVPFCTALAAATVVGFYRLDRGQLNAAGPSPAL
jgi:GPH family glycoside/pentoside/hexuronide:cation symporter